MCLLRACCVLAACLLLSFNYLIVLSIYIKLQSVRMSVCMLSLFEVCLFNCSFVCMSKVVRLYVPHPRSFVRMYLPPSKVVSSYLRPPFKFVRSYVCPVSIIYSPGEAYPVQHQCAHSGTHWHILVEKIDKNLYMVKCQVRTLCAPPPPPSIQMDQSEQISDLNFNKYISGYY